MTWKYLFLVFCLALFAACGNGGARFAGAVATSTNTSAQSDAIWAAEQERTLEQASPPNGVDPDLYALLLEKFRSELSKQMLSNALHLPSSDPNIPKLDLQYEAESGALVWNYINRGDTDFDGEVNIADITPIARYYGSQVDYINRRFEIERWVDLDDSGEVGIGDITIIAMRYLRRLDGFDVYALYSREPNAGWSLLGSYRASDLSRPNPFLASVTVPDDGAIAYRVDATFRYPGEGVERQTSNFAGIDPPPDLDQRTTRDFTDPRTGRTFTIVDGCVMVSISSDYWLDSLEVQAFLQAENVTIYNVWEYMIHAISVYLPPETSVEEAVSEWPIRYSKIITRVDPVGVRTAM